MSASTYNWQQKGWPRFTYNRAHLSDELSAFADAFRKVKAALRTKQDPELIARTLTDEAVVTSRIEGVTVDESVVMSSRSVQDPRRAIGLQSISVSRLRE